MDANSHDEELLTEALQDAQTQQAEAHYLYGDLE